MTSARAERLALAGDGRRQLRAALWVAAVKTKLLLKLDHVLTNENPGEIDGARL